MKAKVFVKNLINHAISLSNSNKVLSKGFEDFAQYVKVNVDSERFLSEAEQKMLALQWQADKARGRW